MPPHQHNSSPERGANNAEIPTNPRNGRAKLPDDQEVAYRTQTTEPILPENNNDTSNNNASNDQLSMSGEANSVATPSSVYMPSSVALSREMSDLSGVSGNASRGSSNPTIPGQILDPKSLLRPWKQAYSLSNIPPECNKEAPASSSSSHDKKSPSIWVAQNDVVEIFDNLESSLGLDRFKIRKHDRIPIMVLLMDPSKQSYELMQIWVDRSIDSIRDLVQVLQHKLPNQWKQAYDGLFQVRGNRFTQLINIIRLVKYDMQPNEILIAKPWSMAAKVTIAIAGSAIRHLTRIGVIENYSNDDGKGRFRYHRKQQRNEDSPLLLSKSAQDRAYFPEGILDHHHATQFITFSPPFESSDDNYNDTQQQTTSAEPATTTSLIPLHKSHDSSSEYRGYDVHSSLLGNNNNNNNNVEKISKNGPGILTLGIRRVIARPKSRRKPIPTLPKRGHGGKSNTSSRKEDDDIHSEEIQFLVDSINDSDGSKTIRTKEQHLNSQSQHPNYFYSSDTTTTTTCGPVGCFSKLNCLRNYNSGTKAKGPEATPHVSMASLSEEEERRWRAYSMKPIDEDQSLAPSSVVSMSAPLLSPSTGGILGGV